VVETSLDNQASIEKLSSYDPGQIAKIFVTKNDYEKRIVMIVSQDSDLFNKTVEVQYVDPANEVFTIIEKPATYPGGLDAFKQYLAENLKYPEEALKNKKEGRVFVQFIVEPDGSLSDVQVVKGIGGACDKEAVRVLMNSPKWIPGEQSGQKVRQKLVQSIQFTLPE
jgi:protein TonB